MVVSTTDEEAVDFRRQVIEWLMMNHPHDCPVCDEGGHCLLQDVTVAGGQGIDAIPERSGPTTISTWAPFIQHEMNRCIHCYRCRRFYQEFAGYRDFGALQIASRMYFGRFSDGPLESPFSGNIIDLCPTGVLTDKPSRYKGRRWDFERSPSLCIHCSLGCRVVASARYREVVRMEAGFSGGSTDISSVTGAGTALLCQPSRAAASGQDRPGRSSLGSGPPGRGRKAVQDHPNRGTPGRCRSGFRPKQPGDPGDVKTPQPDARLARPGIPGRSF